MQEQPCNPMKTHHGLYDHQKIAVNQLKTGSILNGGVGSGKSLTALAYYSKNEKSKFLYIITTAKKRDGKDWEKEINKIYPEFSWISFKIDSWNNIKKYIDVVDAFFIFDEQRVVGSGVWVKSFLKIVKNNTWILLTAAPGDCWLDYVPVFIANGFYKTRTEFIKRHVVYNSFINFPKVDRYIDEDRLIKLKESITVDMNYKHSVITIWNDIKVNYDDVLLKFVLKKRKNPYTDKPIKNVSELFYTVRRIINSHHSRLSAIRQLIFKHKKLIVFYNFDYELEILRELKFNLPTAEYNGHKHEEIPESFEWVYLVQYMAGAEGWNCIETNAVAFFSLNYSYKIMTQAAGRIDRINTPFNKLYYYNLLSDAFIDLAIKKALRNKKDFNENVFFKAAEKTYPLMEGM